MCNINMGEIVSCLEVIHAIECLEYHNKNWLALNDKARNEEKRALLRRTLNNIPHSFHNEKCNAI